MRPRICISNELSGDANLSCPGATLFGSPGLQGRTIWKPPQLVRVGEACQSQQDLHQKKIPGRDEDFFSSCTEWWLNFTVGFGSNSY